MQSELLSRIPGLIHGFGTRSSNVPLPFQAIWDDRRPRWQQVHGTEAAQVLKPAQVCGNVDALHSREPGIPIAVMTADCVPILLSRKDGNAVAAIHSGWRGTIARILDQLWKTRLSPQGESPKDWVAAIGPAIGPCCYQVDEELTDRFAKEFAEFPRKLMVPEFRMLDLQKVNELELRRIGLGEIETLRHCTRCAKAPDGEFLLHSYRREGSGPRQYSVLMITESTPSR